MNSPLPSCYSWSYSSSSSLFKFEPIIHCSWYDGADFSDILSLPAQKDYNRHHHHHHHWHRHLLHWLASSSSPSYDKMHIILFMAAITFKNSGVLYETIQIFFHGIFHIWDWSQSCGGWPCGQPWGAGMGHSVAKCKYRGARSQDS